MHRNFSKLLFAASAAIVLGGLATSAFAGRRQSAFSGAPQQHSDAGCFPNGWGAVTNTCPTTRQFCVPLVCDWSLTGNFANVTVTAKAPAGELMSCITQVVDKKANPVSSSRWINASMNGSFVDIVVNGGGIPDGGAAYTCCNVPPNGTLSVINY